jgi:hypothetical protein
VSKVPEHPVKGHNFFSTHPIEKRFFAVDKESKDEDFLLLII